MCCDPCGAMRWTVYGWSQVECSVLAILKNLRIEFFCLLVSYRDMITPLQNCWVKDVTFWRTAEYRVLLFDVLQNIGCSIYFMCPKNLRQAFLYRHSFDFTRLWMVWFNCVFIVWQRVVDTWEYEHCSYTSCDVASGYHTCLRNAHFVTGGSFWYSFNP